MRLEEERLKSFVKSPFDVESSVILARNGLYYLGRDTRVKCAFCFATMAHFRGNLYVFIREHARLSPQCPFRRCLLIEAASNVAVNRNDTYKPDAVSLDHRLPDGGDRGSGGDDGGPPRHFVHPEYACLIARIESFRYWPKSMRQRPNDLAEAGFFYTGLGDRTKCFSCGGGLKDWEEKDVPMEEHFRHYSLCPYIINYVERKG